MEAFPIAFVAAVLALAVFFATAGSARNRQIVEHWVQSHGYRLLSCKRCWFRHGPSRWSIVWSFFGRRPVYYVIVKTPDGRIQRGWVQCGGRTWGLFQRTVEVRWDWRIEGRR